MYERGLPPRYFPVAVVVLFLVYRVVSDLSSRWLSAPSEPAGSEPRVREPQGLRSPDRDSRADRAAPPALDQTAWPVLPAQQTRGAAPAPTLPQTSAPRAPSRRGRLRWLSLQTLRAPAQPGLCAAPEHRTEAQEQLRARFRALSWGDPALLYVDPSLPQSAGAALLIDLERAEREVGRALGLQPPRPDVFAYSAPGAMRAASCLGADATALYDGALHLVVTLPALPERLLHQYARHALERRDVLGPSWAREGIAMLVARESWWRAPSLLERIAAAPIALASMEETLPDALSRRQAARWYAQAAAMTSCAALDRDQDLNDLVTALEVVLARGELRYRLPPSAEPDHLRSCVAQLAR